MITDGDLFGDGVIAATGQERMPALTHMDVTREQVEQAAGVLADVVLDGAHTI